MSVALNTSERVLLCILGCDVDQNIQVCRMVSRSLDLTLGPVDRQTNVYGQYRYPSLAMIKCMKVLWGIAMLTDLKCVKVIQSRHYNDSMREANLLDINDDWM